MKIIRMFISPLFVERAALPVLLLGNCQCKDERDHNNLTYLDVIIKNKIQF